jgi:hypothetical protein
MAQQKVLQEEIEEIEGRLHVIINVWKRCLMVILERASED